MTIRLYLVSDPGPDRYPVTAASDFEAAKREEGRFNNFRTWAGRNAVPLYGSRDGRWWRFFRGKASPVEPEKKQPKQIDFFG